VENAVPPLRFFVNMENDEAGCQTTGERAPLAELSTEDQENQEPVATTATGTEAATTAAAAEAREALDTIRAGFLVLHKDANRTTALTQQLRITQRGEAQARQERHQATQQQLQ
jgi:hypothetical protein